MKPSITTLRRRCARLLCEDKLSRRELADALGEIDGLEEWILDWATDERFHPDSIEAVLVRFGSSRVQAMAGAFFAEALLGAGA